ncbi:MAG: EAL domain-containing protein [Chloroflexota bacterium]|nr:EAL domain-containing protein [Chloroflexota bacterium]
MYRAKEASCGRIEVSRRGEPLLAGEDLAADLRRAIERQELRVYYQPRLELATGAVVGMEALVRWHHPRLGLLTPGQFLPLAEAEGHLRTITSWVLRKACSQIAKWREMYADRTLFVSVNVSRSELLDRSLPEAIAYALERYGLDPGALQLEMDGGYVLDEPTTGAAWLSRLKVLGIRLALDGPLSEEHLDHLGTLPVESVQVARSWVAALDREPGGLGYVRAVVSAAHRQGMVVVAAGVETEDQLGQLRELGCDLGQGYLLGRPLPPVTVGLPVD